MKKKKIIVAMSGGVDSSVTAWLLKKNGYLVEGVFMINWEQNNINHNCSLKTDLEDVKKVCKFLEIKLHVIDFSYEYWNLVFKKFIYAYKKGDTPNPDILCNKEIKFKIFLNFSLNVLRANYIATGHYAIIKKKNNKYNLFRGIDEKKDQSYFLYTLTQKVLSKIFFPLGKIKKINVRKIAKKINLFVAKKKDSVGICFISPKKFTVFLKQFIPPKIGKILTMSGECLGFHIGISHYTIGQRKGLQIGGKKGKNMYPWYVVKKNRFLNIIFVVQGRNNPYLLSFGFFAININWINPIKKKKIYCFVQIKYYQKAKKCYVCIQNKEIIKIIFIDPIVNVTIGQSAVFYKFNKCLGGAEINKIIPYIP